MTTEDRNPATAGIDKEDGLGIARLMNTEDRLVAGAVEAVLPEIGKTIDSIVPKLEKGGRLFYVGAGTSGRLGVLDAVECQPTFGVSPEQVQAIIAGGFDAVSQAVEAAEDEAGNGRRDIAKRGVRATDAVVGLTASGRTPYTLGALQQARSIGAFTAGITCNRNAPIEITCEVVIAPEVGPEVIAGSTRLKSGTAQKMILNMISTGTMIRLGNVYSNLMVNLNMGSQKLIDRGVRIVCEAASVTEAQAREALRKVGDVRSAIVMLQLGCTPDEARGLVSQSNRVNEILKEQ